MKTLGNLALLMALGLLTAGCQNAADSVQDDGDGTATTVADTKTAPGNATAAAGNAAAAAPGGAAADDRKAGAAVRDASDVAEYTKRAIHDAGKDAVNPASWQQTWGKVTFQGKPVGRAEVMFYRKASPFNRMAHTDEQGEFECRTHLGKGLPVGEYQVVVRPIFVDPVLSGNFDPNDPIPPQTRNDIPAKYQQRKSTPLSIKVVEGNNEMNIVLDGS